MTKYITKRFLEELTVEEAVTENFLHGTTTEIHSIGDGMLAIIVTGSNE